MKKMFYIAYIAMVIVLNWFANPIMLHLNKRGVITSFWVINDEDEIKKILATSTISGIMTDRPEYVNNLMEEHRKMN